jgi:hypothetical protein
LIKSDVDDYYELYAWDVVDIFFATIVASLPALNGVFGTAVSSLKSWGSVSATQLVSKLRSVRNRSRGSQDYNTKLSDKESKEESSVDVTEDRSSNRLHTYRERFSDQVNIEYGIPLGQLRSGREGVSTSRGLRFDET